MFITWRNFFTLYSRRVLGWLGQPGDPGERRPRDVTRQEPGSAEVPGLLRALLPHPPHGRDALQRREGPRWVALLTFIRQNNLYRIYHKRVCSVLEDGILVGVYVSDVVNEKVSRIVKKKDWYFTHLKWWMSPFLPSDVSPYTLLPASQNFLGHSGTEEQVSPQWMNVMKPRGVALGRMERLNS